MYPAEGGRDSESIERPRIPRRHDPASLVVSRLRQRSSPLPIVLFGHDEISSGGRSPVTDTF
jgi:hypothetical protein